MPGRRDREADAVAVLVDEALIDLGEVRDLVRRSRRSALPAWPDLDADIVDEHHAELRRVARRAQQRDLRQRRALVRVDLAVVLLLERPGCTSFWTILAQRREL